MTKMYALNNIGCYPNLNIYILSFSYSIASYQPDSIALCVILVTLF